MRKKISEQIRIPEGVNVYADSHSLKLNKGGVELEKRIYYPVKIEGNIIKVECEKPTKKQKKLIKSTAAHIRNLIAGLDKKYVYKLQICAVHFPITATVKGEDFVVKNFLGERKERITKILPGVHVKIDKEVITVESADKEKAGQTSANIENVTRIVNRDRRIFQDGIFIVEKNKGAKR
jgi:large subunit ribosomal protein L6